MQNKFRVMTVLFEGFELLDVFGPLEMFGTLGERFDIKLVSQQGTPVKSSQGPVSVMDFSFSNAAEADILLIPGGFGTKTEVHNDDLLAWLKDKSQNCQYVASVCNGAVLLARAGLLDNKRATTNKLDFKWVMTHGPQVDWVREARWVEDGNYFTSSGVSAGMDMSLALIGRLCGESVADDVAIRAEYSREKDAGNDPFAKIHGLV